MNVTNDRPPINYYQKKQQEQEQLLQAHAAEMRKVRELQKEQKEEIIARGQIELEQTSITNDLKKDQQIELQQQQLAQKLAQFQRQKEQLLAEEKLAQTIFQDKMADKQTNFELQAQQLQTHLQNQNQMLQNEKRAQLANITQKQTLDVQKLRSQALAEYQQEVQSSQHKLNQQHAHLTQQRMADDYQLRSFLAASKAKQEKRVDDLTKEQNRQLQNQTTNHEKKLLQIQQHQQDVLNQSHQAFLRKAEQLAHLHQEKLATTMKKYQQEVEQLQTNLAAKHLQLRKTEDPFYQLEKIEPKIHDRPHEVIVELSVPEHEKDLVIANANNRKITLALGRRFQERQENPDGSINKTQRSEVVAQDFLVNDILDGRHITRTYRDGTLSFAIPKK